MSRIRRQGLYRSDDQRWEAVVRSDQNADGKFFYAVKTTGVYCRPSCAARQPQRANVQFYASCEAAERAGFRACKRCQPNGRDLSEQHAIAVAKACRLIRTAERPPDLATLARSVAMSPFHFHRVFAKIMGLTPKAYVQAHRAERVREALPQRNTVTEAIYDAGYGSNSRFYEKSLEMLGMRPSAFRKGGVGATIRFAVGDCSLGSVLVASSERGVCAILMGDDPAQLARDLQDRFPKASLIGGDRDFQRVISKVIALIESPRTRLDLPLYLRGTAFQQKVWRALRHIPAGKTISYSELARRLGKPKAVRALAQACAANPLAVAIPCHRVLGANGSLSGYRWGVERKRALLKRESKKR
ncbi:MAG: bifunctional DNA-binding transcriptional regulator/O6-methylguanine-DNA methyltransferase Ada [Verrucomicrobia subdivision 3 bacterium]|nr:bifunctional DNA-binding transcriptional regulator/O6-methylguanine-DNA methyltransferase Ada [Limisphaerales bacterium]